MKKNIHKICCSFCLMASCFLVAQDSPKTPQKSPRTPSTPPTAPYIKRNLIQPHPFLFVDQGSGFTLPSELDFNEQINQINIDDQESSQTQPEDSWEPSLLERELDRLLKKYRGKKLFPQKFQNNK